MAPPRPPASPLPTRCSSPTSTMDFFEAQALARKRTGRLVTLFVLAVLGIILGGYFATIFSFRLAHQADPTFLSDAFLSWWQPDLLAAVALITLLIVGLSSFIKWRLLRAGGGAIAESVGGHRVQPGTTDPLEKRLLNVVEEMSIASGTPVPPVYLLPDESSINGFAAGLTPSDAAIALTRGALEKLNRDELQAVVAHEFSHILNGDMRLNTRLTAILFGILVVALLGRTLLRTLFYARPRGGGRGKGGGGALLLALAALGLIITCLGYLGFFFGRLIQAAVSRQREYLADASAVQFTRNPAGITGALSKIGGYAVSSYIQNRQATEISHFFFAQAFRAPFLGSFSTHPPLDVRIRAIDPSFDGKFYEPQAKVDVANTSFKDAARTKTRDRRPPSPLPAILPLPGVSPGTSPAALPGALAVIAAIGQPTAAHVDRAHSLLESLPAPLRDAAHQAPDAPAVLYALLLDADPEVKKRQLALVEKHAPASSALLEKLAPHAIPLPPEARLPLLQITLPSLRDFSPDQLDPLLATLDELVHADARVTPFEYALQKVLAHHLGLAQRPSNAPSAHLGPGDLVQEITLLLSVFARAGDRTEDDQATPAFHAGSVQFAGLHPSPSLLPAEACTLEALDPALDRLAQASGPAKKRLLTALAQIIASDGQLHPEENELLRAVAATLDCPMPPLLVS